MSNDEKLMQEIDKTLGELGIPRNQRGYYYVRFALAFAAQYPSTNIPMCSVLYPTVAKEFGSTPTRVERGIRRAIETAFDRCDAAVLKGYFGNTINPHKGEPTNSEFIFQIVGSIKHKTARRAEQEALCDKLDAMRRDLLDDLLCERSVEYAATLKKYKEVRVKG